MGGPFCANLLLQPVAALLCWTGVCKVTLGLFGQVAYAWRRIPESELAGLTPRERRTLASFCVFQGVAALAFGATLCVSCAWLLVQAVLG